MKQKGKPTVEVFLVVLEGEGSVVLPEADDGRDVLGVLVGEALHQHVLVGPPRADLQQEASESDSTAWRGVRAT